MNDNASGREKRARQNGVSKQASGVATDRQSMSSKSDQAASVTEYGHTCHMCAVWLKCLTNCIVGLSWPLRDEAVQIGRPTNVCA